MIELGWLSAGDYNSHHELESHKIGFMTHHGSRRDRIQQSSSACCSL